MSRPAHCLVALIELADSCGHLSLPIWLVVGTIHSWLVDCVLTLGMLSFNFMDLEQRDF